MFYYDLVCIPQYCKLFEKYLIRQSKLSHFDCISHADFKNVPVTNTNLLEHNTKLKIYRKL